MEKLTVMSIDDQEDFRTLLTEFLEEEGYDVMGAALLTTSFPDDTGNPEGQDVGVGIWPGPAFIIFTPIPSTASPHNPILNTTHQFTQIPPSIRAALKFPLRRGPRGMFR